MEKGMLLYGFGAKVSLKEKKLGRIFVSEAFRFLNCVESEKARALSHQVSVSAAFTGVEV